MILLPRPISKIMRLLKVVALCLILFPFKSFALTPSEQRAIDQSIQIEQRLQRERQDVIKQKEITEIDNIGQSKKRLSTSDSKGSLVDNGDCRKIDKIKIENNYKISSKTLKKYFIQKYEGKCITKTDLKNLKDSISNFYFEKGYISARVYFNAEEILQGVLKIVIEEGRIEEINIQDSSILNNELPYRQNFQRFSAFPFLKEEVLNLRDIEQGLDQINRLSSNNATMNIESGKDPGYSKIVVDNRVGHLTNITLSRDNSGNQSTGKFKNKLTLNQDNLLGINDNIYLNYSNSDYKNKKDKYSRSFYSAISIPFGYYTLGGSYSHSEYLITTVGDVTTLRSSGNTENKTFYVDRVLNRGKKHKISLKLELDNSDTDTYLEDTYLPINSRRITSANLYLNNTFYTKTGSIYIQPYYGRGLKIMNALSDGPDLSKNSPKAQYEYYGLYGSINRSFKIPKFKIPLSHHLTFDSRYSKDSLYSNKQFGIGGRYSVRGFEESQVTGDSGYYIRNDLKVNSSYLVPKSIEGSKLFGHKIFNKNSLNGFLSRTNLGVFYDYGYARSKIVDEDSDEGHMSGVGAKLDYLGRYINWSIIYSKGLHSPNFLRNIDKISKDGESIYLNMSLKFSLF